MTFGSFCFWKVEKTTRYVFEIVHPPMEGPFCGEWGGGMNPNFLRCQEVRETVDSSPLPDWGVLSGGELSGRDLRRRDLTW